VYFILHILNLCIPTGTDENINALRLLMQQMNNKFTIFRTDEGSCFCMGLEDICGAMTYKDLDIGDWIIFKSEEGKEVVKVTTDKLILKIGLIILDKTYFIG
jgi:hypothetical protein